MTSNVFRWARAAFIVMTLGAVAASCGVGWEDVQVSHVTVGDDDRTLLVGGHCHHDATVTATETTEEVRVLLRGYEYRGDCLDSAQVTLESPLDGRPIIDVVTGEAVEPCDPLTEDERAC